jgi:ABC-type Zn uptake system ZnuABC Zn-binding protein ZnuA
MKKIEQADVLVLNGVELEEFMADALSGSDAAVIDCSVGVELLPAAGHDEHADHDHGHEHDHGHWDSHIWLDPANAARMALNLAEGFAQLDPERKSLYTANAQTICDLFQQTSTELRSAFDAADSLPELITFHDGFGYFAHAFDLHLLRAIEEEAGSEASAKEIVDISRLIRERSISLIFTEVNGSEATAKAISRETGCSIAQLTMLMDGSDVTDRDDLSSILARYTDALRANARAILGEVSLP